MTSRKELSFWTEVVVPVEPGQHYPSQSQPKYISYPPSHNPPSTHYTIVWKTDAGVEVTLSFHYLGEFSHCDHSWHMTTFNLNLNSQLAQPGFWTVINLPRGLHFVFLHVENKKMNRVTQTWLFCHGMLMVWMKEIFWKEQEMFAI